MMTIERARRRASGAGSAGRGPAGKERAAGAVGRFVAVALVSAVWTSGARAQESAPGDGTTAAGAPVTATIDAALERGVRWLAGTQNADGGFGPAIRGGTGSTTGISAFGVYALARTPAELRRHSRAALERGVAFLLSNQQEDGSFHDVEDPSLKNYKTSVAILALAALDREKYAPQIARAAEFIKSQQVVGAGETQADGGFGYGNRDRNADVSNTQFALEALHEAGISGADDTYSRAVRFLERVQNLKGKEPIRIQKGEEGKPDTYRHSTGDGGFVYRVTETRGPSESGDGTQKFSSYGSMTYAGLKSFLYAHVDRDDPRVQAAFDWISRNFTVEENPGMGGSDPLAGRQGLFYYYHTMAKALSVYGQRVIKDAEGVEHDWAVELGRQLADLQKEPGFWVNEADRWMESLEVLTTSYALVALTVCREELAAAAASGRKE